MLIEFNRLVSFFVNSKEKREVDKRRSKALISGGSPFVIIGGVHEKTRV